MKKKRWSAGFSLVELLLAVAILATLCGFGFVSVMQQRKNLKIMEASETAKEIFLAAQEHLSMAATQGRLQPKEDESALLSLTIAGAQSGVEVKDGENAVVYYAVFDEERASGSDNGGAVAETLSATASDVMLPQGAVDEFVLNQRYAISYNAEAYRVLDVFYTEDNDYVFKHANGELWTESKTWDDGKTEVRDNPGDFRVDTSQKAVIMGWYGEDALLYGVDGNTARKPSNPQGITPSLDLINGPVLFAVVALDEEHYSYSDVALKIEGADGGFVSIPIFGNSDRVKEYKRDNENGVTYYMVILDDVTRPGFGFGDLSPDDPAYPITPGSDIRVTVEARGQEKQAEGSSANLEVYSDTKQCNSLFADNSSVFADSSDSEKAHIKNFRHLQNLSELTPGDKSGDSGKKSVEATLDNDIEWDSYCTTVGYIRNIYDIHGDISYNPVNVGYELDFVGNNKTIRNLEIDNVDASNNEGVFGTLNGVSAIKNLKLENTVVSANGATAAGALVGDSTQSLTVDNVSSSSGGSITAKDYAGGLIGRAAGKLTVTSANAQISSGCSVTATEANGEAGGLIGGASGTISVKNAETVSNGSITAKNYAGGLIGQANGSVDVENARAHISSGGVVEATDSDGVAGGLIGIASGEVSVKYSASYSKDFAAGGGNGTPGIVKAGANGVAGGLIGAVDERVGAATVEGCAAANQVMASTATGSESIAGGLIGKTSGNVGVSASYAGGVTENGGKYNHSRVSGTNNTLNGNVQGAYAGGLIGQAGGNLTLDNVYSAASAYGSKDASSVYPAYGAGNVTKENTVYGAGEYQGASSIQSGKPVSSDNPTTGGSPSTGGSPYDAGLSNASGNTKYPYQSLQDMDASLKNSPYEWIQNHVGDWPGGKGTSLPAVIWGADGVQKVKVGDDDVYTVANDDVRYAWIDLSECDLANQPYITLSVSNLEDGSDAEIKDKTQLYTFEIRNGAVVGKDGNPNAAYTTTGPDGASGGSGQWLRVTLDDISTKGQRFRDLFPTLNPAQEIRIHAKAYDSDSASDSLTVDDLLNDAQPAVRWKGDKADADKPNIASPLFDIALSDRTDAGVTDAGITNIRHLQNLDTSVSGVGKSVPGDNENEKIRAQLAADLDWDDWNNKPIYVGDEGGYVTSFYGIENEKLTAFDGQNHTLSDFVIDRANDNNMPDGSGSPNAGLFRTLTGKAENLNLEGFKVTAGDGGNAGILAANAETGGDVAFIQVSNILINTNGASVTAENYAGGMIGYAEGMIVVTSCASYSKDFADSDGNGSPGRVTATGENGVAGGLIGAIHDESLEGLKSKVEGCAAANIVTADGEKSVAGGLIGQASGSVDVSYSYAGGVTTEGGASVQGAHAGGLIGQAVQPDGDDPTITLEKVYSSATVGGTETGGLYTGGATVKDPTVSYGTDNLQPHTENSGSAIPTVVSEKSCFLKTV